MHSPPRGSAAEHRARAAPPHRRAARGVLAALCTLALAACAIEPRQPERRGGVAADTAVSEDRWLTGSVDERNRAIERQFAGFSQSMWEVGYRYTELYHAIREQNWALAAYHAEKIGDAVERGIERRPARAGNARFMLLDETLPGLLGAIEMEDTAAANARFRLLTESCNTCHEAEEVPFVRVAPPERRLAPIGPRAPDRADERARDDDNDREE